MYLKTFNKSVVPYASFYVFIFMAIAIFFSFINIYFYQLGFTISQIGFFSALAPVVTIFSQPVWGVLSDRTNKRRVLMIVISTSAVMSVVLSMGTSFLFIVVTLIIYSTFAVAILPLADAITLQFLENANIKYSAIRVLGAVSFGITAIFAGVLLDGDISRIFWYNALFMAGTLAAVFFMSNRNGDPPKDGSDPHTKEKIKFSETLKNKVVLGVYLSSFIFGLVMSFLFGFIGIRMTEIGANEGQIGFALFIASFSEIPLFLFMDRLFGKRRPEHLLMFSAFFMGIRLFILYLSESIFLVYIAQGFHGVSFVVHLYFCIVLLHRHSPEHMKSTVQTIHSMIRMGASALLGSLSGGFLAQHIGIQNVFLLMSVIVFSTCFILPGVLILIHKAKRRRLL